MHAESTRLTCMRVVGTCAVNLANFQPCDLAKGHQQPVQCIVAGPASRIPFSGSPDGTVRCWRWN